MAFCPTTRYFLRSQISGSPSTTLADFLAPSILHILFRTVSYFFRLTFFDGVSGKYVIRSCPRFTDHLTGGIKTLVTTWSYCLAFPPPTSLASSQSSILQRVNCSVLFSLGICFFSAYLASSACQSSAY